MDGIHSTVELLARRLIAQGLASSAARPDFDSPADVTSGLLALQGQTYLEGVRSIAVRHRGTDADVLAAIGAGRIVRAWPQRGTLHFLAAEDARWLGRLLYPRVHGSQKGRRKQLGLSEDMVAAAHSALLETLLQHDINNPLPRAAVYELFASIGVDPKEGRGSHLLRAFGGQGDIVQGPKPENKWGSPAAETFLHVDALPQPQRHLEGEAALRELALRYATGHGPVNAADLQWWTALSKSQSTAALHLASDELATAEFNGTTYFMAAWQNHVTAAEITAALALQHELPAFDEYLLGYANKSQIVPDDIRGDILTKNGLSWPWVMRRGVGIKSRRPR